MLVFPLSVSDYSSNGNTIPTSDVIPVVMALRKTDLLPVKEDYWVADNA